MLQSSNASQHIIPVPLPASPASYPHFLSVITASLAYFLPVTLPSPIRPKAALNFRSSRDFVVLVGSIFALQSFAMLPGPAQLDALVVLPLAMASFVLYEAPLPPLKAAVEGMNTVCLSISAPAV